MADNRAVWGIDIGQAGLKAIKLKYAESAGQAMAVAFDYVPHPKILSQPDAIPEELIPQALETFLSRNEIDGDLISISVPGKASLARFVSLPPVESSKVAEIVKFEAKQQIPFPLDEVIWDWQPLGEADEASGFMIDAEVGLFAMKRSEVLKQLQPFTERKVEVELIQTAPVALYNALLYDELGFRPDGAAPESDDYYVVLDMGCDDTTLVITNGEKIWIRTVNIGGNHFTRALVKEMKLSFAKAEHLKCNATKAPDPKAVFQALRPVFNDYVAEIKRSIGFFTGVNRQANITKVFGLGNGFKLAGLQKYLQHNLDYEVDRPEAFKGLAGDAVLNSPLFQENLLSFPVAYGLAVQTLGAGRLTTTLLPPEIALDRKIRRKKPWAVAAAAVLLAGFSTSMALNARAYDRVKPGPDGIWDDAEKQAADYGSLVGTKTSAYESQVGRFNAAKDTTKTLVEGRRDLKWLELFNAINAALPRDDAGADGLSITERRALNITSVTAQHVDDVGSWFTESVTENAKSFMPPGLIETPPSGEGYIITITGKSWHNDPNNYRLTRELYVMSTLVQNLREWQIERGGRTYDVRRLGVSHPVLASQKNATIMYTPPAGTQTDTTESRFADRARTGPNRTEQDGAEKLAETQFRVEFAWTPTPIEERAETDPNATIEDEVQLDENATLESDEPVGNPAAGGGAPGGGAAGAVAPGTDASSSGAPGSGDSAAGAGAGGGAPGGGPPAAAGGDNPDAANGGAAAPAGGGAPGGTPAGG